jgi:two-component system, OmpR family, sensor histidine kinase VicK
MLRQMQISKEDEECGHTDVYSLVEEVFAGYLDKVQNKKITFQNTIVPQLYAQIPDKSIYLMIEELINNAIRFTPEGGTIIFSAESDESRVTISITDNGIGLNSEEKERIFEDFYKADTARHSIDTHGLGLAIIKKVLERYQGTIAVISKGSGYGTTIYFTLPVKR